MESSPTEGEEAPFFDTSLWVKGGWYRPIQPWVEKAASISAINRVAQQADLPNIPAHHFADRLLTLLQVEWTLQAPDLPTNDGRGSLILANHPTGFVEALVLMKVLHQLAPSNWKLLGNEFVARKRQFADNVIALDPFNAGGGARINRLGLRAASQSLRNGGVVGAFPAGRVAARKDGPHKVIDQPWSPHFLRLAKATDSRIFVARMPWIPGALMRRFPTSLPALRALLLSQEAFRHQLPLQTVTLAPAPNDLSDDAQVATTQLQNFCHALPSC